MPFVLSKTDLLNASTVPEKGTLQGVIDNCHQIALEFAHLALLGACIMLSLRGVYNFNSILLVVPTFLLIYSLIVWIAYACLMAYKPDRHKNNESTLEKNAALNIILATAFFIHYTKYVGRLLGGTQWLVIALRRFGACIGDDVIIDDMQSLYDVHLITIGDHTRLSSTCQIQVKLHVTHCLICAFLFSSVIHSSSVALNFVPLQLAQLVFSGQCHLYYRVLSLLATIVLLLVHSLCPMINLQHTPIGSGRQQNVLLCIMAWNRQNTS
jgi:hypothetical protein